jgi:hypothetical protein
VSLSSLMQSGHIHLLLTLRAMGALHE